MKAKLALAALLAATCILPLSGCFGLPGIEEVSTQADDLASQAEDFASQTQELADTLSNVEWGKVSRLVVKDAETGEIIRELADQTDIEHAFSSLSGTNGLAAEPDGSPEYTFELWQPETQKLGQSVEDLEEIMVLEVTTYEGSPVVMVEVCPVGISLHLSSQPAADALRTLAK